jgi:molecular chaperone DnaK (HSP70)
MPRGQAELVTTFEIDANGLLKVSAMDRASGRKASISKNFPESIPDMSLMISFQASPTLSAVSPLQRSTK